MPRADRSRWNIRPQRPEPSEMTQRSHHQLSHFVMRQKCRRTTAPMQLRDGPGWFETCRLQQKLAFQPIEIRTRMRTIFCSDLVAAAIEADGVAEWNMEVERKIRRCRSRSRRSPMVMAGIEGGGELNSAR